MNTERGESPTLPLVSLLFCDSCQREADLLINPVDAVYVLTIFKMLFTRRNMLLLLAPPEQFMHI